MDTERVSQPSIQADTQPTIQSPVIPSAVPAPTRKTNYTIYIIIFLFVGIAEAIISYFVFIKIPAQKSSATQAVPTISLLPSPTPTPVLCSDAPCLVPQFLACVPSKLTMPFTEGSSFILTVFGKDNDHCRYTLTITDTKTNTLINSSECTMPMEKMTKDTLGHLFGQDKTPGQEAVKAEQDRLESQYCVTKTPTSTPSAIPSAQANPTPKKVTCGNNDQNCIFTNIIGNFTGGCIPTEVSTTVDTGQQVTLTISRSTNGACGFQMKGLGVDQNCLFTKENVTTTVIKGILGMDNIPKDPEFIKIKAASCK